MVNYTFHTDNESETGFFFRSRPETVVLINCAFNRPLMLKFSIENTLMLAAIIRNPSIRSNSIIMLCSLAASDYLFESLLNFSHCSLYIAKEQSRSLVP